MERRIRDAKDQYTKLKGECEATVELLNTLIQTCGRHIETLDSNDHQINLKYFLKVSQYQHATHQKILELNLNLEEYLLENPVSDLECRETPRTSLSTYSDSVDYQYTRPVDLLILDNHESSITSKSVTDGNVKVNNNGIKIENFQDGDNVTNFATSSVLNESASTNNSEIYFELDDEESITPILDSQTQKVPVDEVLCKQENIEQPPQLHKKQSTASYISETLKSISVVASEKKFIDNLPKVEMPDIALKPSHVKRFVVVDDKLDTVEDKQPISDVYVLEERKVINQCTFNENVGCPVDNNVREDAGFEIKHRSSPLVGDICMIGYVESPSNFYIQVSDENSVLIDVISSQLAEINTNSLLLCDTKHEAINKLGSLCTLAIDGIWYRGEVIDWLQNTNSDQVFVQLIDYGGKYSVSYQSLRPLPKFCRSHRLAQKCYLAYLYPPGSTKDKKLKKWPIACQEAFLNYCGDMDISDFRITYICPSAHEPNAYEIDLVRLCNNSDDKSIGEILLEAELANQIFDDLEGIVKHGGMCNQILAAHGIAGITSDMTQEQVLDIYFEEVEEEPSNINEAVMKYNPRDEAETCRNLRPDGTCYKGSSCKWRHDVLKSGFTNDKEAVYSKTFTDMCLPDAGEDILLTISHVVDLQCFYAQIKSTASGISNSINDLINTMNEPQTVKTYKKFNQMPYSGEVVIAKYWNNYWYRGQVRDVDAADYKNAQAEIYFVDFGDILTIPISDLRNIMPEFLTLPFQAIECQLYNWKHREGANEKLEKTSFEKKLLGVTLKAHIVAVPGHLQVLLENSNGEDVGLQLIEEGVGELKTEHNFPGANELILID